MTIAQVVDFRTNFDETHPFSNIVARFRLAADTELTWTVPGEPQQNFVAEFGYSNNAEFWVKKNGTATVPAAGTVDTGYNEELNPENRLYVQGGDVLHLISSGTPQVSIKLYATPRSK